MKRCNPGDRLLTALVLGLVRVCLEGVEVRHPRAGDHRRLHSSHLRADPGGQMEDNQENAECQSLPTFVDGQ